MICSSVYLLFFMSVILLVDGLPLGYAGTAGRGQVTAVSDLASNFVLRWNSVNPQRLRLPLPPPPKAYAKPGTCSMQMLRSASHKMVEAELKATAAADKPRVHGASGHNHIHHAYVRLIEQAEHFIYIENQFFVSAYGSPGMGTAYPMPMRPSHRRKCEAPRPAPRRPSRVQCPAMPMHCPPTASAKRWARRSAT
jgi:hypothetical protein